MVQLSTIIRARDLQPRHLVRVGVSTSYVLVTALEPDGASRIKVTFGDGSSKVYLPGDEVAVSVLQEVSR